MLTCGACALPAICHWQRRPTDAEMQSIVSAETARRNGIIALSDPDQPPVFPAMPDATTTVIAVYACANHAVSQDLAARIHASNCVGPASTTLPNCGCTAEPLPTAPAQQPDTTPVLPVGWH